MPEYKNPKPCADCGEPTTYRNRRGLCKECAMNAMLEGVTQIIERRGPVYEKWRANMARAARRDDAAKEAEGS